ncbi:MFS domain-containing protein [Mycena kentingensis (nom. inval.)]|nr:MFS domain-containing protein [Mycena kentingensis (nom. inval.)]
MTSEPNESTPLLRNDLESQNKSNDEPAPPFPTTQLTALCVARAVDPIAYTQIFPYINEWLFALGTTPDVSKIGIYSGMVEAIFAVTQSLTSYGWAAISDRVGRRPVILIGSGGLAILTLLLGLCESFWGIMIIRGIGGMLAGNLATYHSILAEITHKSHEHISYPLYSSIWPLGSVLGPLMGSQLSNLGSKYPMLFGSQFVLRYPYFAPNAFCTLLVVLGFVMSYFFLEETLPSKRRGASAVVTTPPPSYGVKDLLALPKIRAVTASSFTLAFIGTAFDIGFVLFCYTPVERGGLSFTVDEIGYALALNGSILAVFQLFLMPILLKRVKPHNLYNSCLRMWPLTFFLVPFLNLILRAGVENETVKGGARVWLWAGIVVVLICSRLSALAFGTNMLLVRDSSPSPSCLGAVNGLVQVIMGGSRCFSPAFISSVFAYSIDNRLFGGFPRLGRRHDGCIWHRMLPLGTYGAVE